MISYMMAHPYLGTTLIAYCFTVMAWAFAAAFSAPSYYLQQEDDE